jgi:hypothetical protein
MEIYLCGKMLLQTVKFEKNDRRGFDAFFIQTFFLEGGGVGYFVTALTFMKSE